VYQTKKDINFKPFKNEISSKNVPSGMGDGVATVEIEIKSVSENALLAT
jgi:hypothetical protein